MKRIFEILKDEKWIPIEMEYLRKGDQFRIFDQYDDGLQKVIFEDKDVFTCLDDTYKNENDLWTVNIK